MKFSRILALACGTSALALAAASPVAAQITFSQSADLTPNGTAYAAPSAGGTVCGGSSGFIDKHGSIWSCNTSSQLIAAAPATANTASNSELVSPQAASTSSQIRLKFVALAPSSTNLYATGLLFKYSNSGGSATTAYGIAINETTASTTTITMATIVNGGQSGSFYTITGAALTAGTTYCLVGSATAVSTTSTTLAAELYQSDCITEFGSMAGSTSDTTAALQNISGGAAIWNYTTKGVIPITEVTTYVPTPATSYTLTGPASGVAGAAATFTVAANGALSSTITVTPAVSGGAGTFNPTSVTMTSALPSTHFNFTPAASGSDAISVVSSPAGTLTDPSAATYTVNNAALTIGTLSATPSSSAITLGLSAALTGGTGSGYNYTIYKGTDPNFTANSGSIVYTGSTIPYVDTSVVHGQQYYYGVVGNDSSAATVNAIPVGYSTGSYPLTASTLFYSNTQLSATSINLPFAGDSITNGYLNANPGTTSSPIITGTVSSLQKLLGTRAVYPFNGGIGGTATADWLPPGHGGAGSGSCAAYGGSSSACYWLTYSASNPSSGASTLNSNNPSALMVGTIMLGANDCNHSVTATTFTANLRTIATQFLGTDWPTGVFVIHMPVYFTPNIYAGASTLSLCASYRPAIMATVAQLKTQFPGRVFVGDTYSYNFFSLNYASEMWPQVSYGGAANGTGYLHPNQQGDADLGNLWATSIVNALYGPQPNTPQFRSH